MRAFSTRLRRLHEDAVYLWHMLETAKKAVARAQGRARADLDTDEDLRILLAYWVQIVGEAAGRISDATKAAHSELPWRRIIGMRHRLVHDYTNIDVDILWEVVDRNLPELITFLEAILPEEV